MTQLATNRFHPAGPPLAAAPSSITTRFGTLALDPGRLITLPSGLLGFANCRSFALVDLPEAQHPVKLLQSVDEPELAFLVLPDRTRRPGTRLAGARNRLAGARDPRARDRASGDRRCALLDQSQGRRC
jgi:hypothetical protein